MKIKLAFKIKLIIVFGFLSCQKQSDLNDMYKEFTISKKNILADGSTIVKISLQIDEKASTDRRSIIFETTGGTFNGSNKITVKAEYINGLLISSTDLKAPFTPGLITISAKPEFDSPIKEYYISDTINASFSNAASIKLEPSMFGIASNFLNSVGIVGKLKNLNSKNVSKGVEVFFEDILPDGNPANGQFKEKTSTTNDSSMVRNSYSASNHQIGMVIKIRVTVLLNKIKTNISDSIQLTINQ